MNLSQIKDDLLFVIQDVNYENLTNKQKSKMNNLVKSIFEDFSEETYIHSIDVANISEQIAKQMHLSQKECNELFVAGMFHDLGKIFIPQEILEKKGKLTADEYNIMKKHVNLSKILLDGVVDEKIENIVLKHHEKLDGSGYPNNLTSDKLNKQERIIAVADILSALTLKRCYKDALPEQISESELKFMANDNKIDSEIVDCVIENCDTILSTARNNRAEINKNDKNFAIEEDVLTN